MSASLVGSEMCIRDRPLDRAIRFAAGSRGSPVAVRGLNRGLNRGLFWPCLLYTSDAADDM
eukprot:13381703-Alexandrium_andersonii.AAC.1